MTASRPENSPETFPKTDRNRVRRVPQRANYDRQTVHAILDEGLVCHLGFVVDHQPFVIPTAYGRVGETLYIHGSPASRMLRTLQTGLSVCVTVTLLDGLVLARSVFHHSMNYRSVVLFGEATLVADPAAKLAALKAFTNQVVPDRWDAVRAPNPAEFNGTTVLALPITEASAKIRTGPPKDDEADYALPVWAGVIPLSMSSGLPTPDPRLPEHIPVPPGIQDYHRPRPSVE